MMSEGSDDSDPISDAVGFIEYILQSNVDLQHQGLKGLMLCKTTHVVELFKNPSFFYHIKRHPNHKLNHSPNSPTQLSPNHNHNHNSSNTGSPTSAATLSPPTIVTTSPTSSNKSPSPFTSPNCDPCNQVSPKTKYSDIDLEKYTKKRKSTLKCLIDLSLSETKRIQSSALRLLWHLSAQADLKVLLYEEGVLDKLKLLVIQDSQFQLNQSSPSSTTTNNDAENRANSIHRTEITLASSAILQNITEYRFERGEINPNQVKIVNEGIIELMLLPRSKSTDRRVQFLTTLTIANLSMNEENHAVLQGSKAFDIVESFVTNNSLHMDLVCHWITLQPHIPLLHSKYPQVQLFALYCLYNLMRSDQYKVEVWKGLSVNNGVQSIFLLLHSTHPKVVELARKIADQLQIEEPSVTVNTTKIGSDLKKLFNNPDFSDVCFVCEGRPIYAHKAICASRCEQLRAMFTWGKESKEQQIQLPHIPYSSMYGVLEYIYCGVASITWENACDLLQWADFFSLAGLKSRCEFFLWHYIDVDNAAIILSVADNYGCTQLRNVSANFVVRNWSKIKDTDSWISHVSPELKSHITDKVFSLVTCSCGCFCSCIDDASESNKLNNSDQVPEQEDIQIDDN